MAPPLLCSAARPAPVQVARRPRLAVSHLVLPGISLCALAACGKPDDAKSVDLIRKVTVHQKLVHVPNEHVRRMLAEHGIAVRSGDGCPVGFGIQPRAFVEPDGHFTNGCTDQHALITQPWDQHQHIPGRP